MIYITKIQEGGKDVIYKYNDILYSEKEILKIVDIKNFKSLDELLKKSV